MSCPQRVSAPQAADQAVAAVFWPGSSPAELQPLRPLLASGLTLARVGAGATLPSQRLAAQTLLRRGVPLAPRPLRPYFAICALEGWRRVPVRQLASWSGIPPGLLQRRLALNGLTPGGVAAWNFALHATWLLDVAELPAGAVVSCMRLGRTTALGRVLGARGVSFTGGGVRPGAFSETLRRYLDLLRAAFGG